MNNPKLVLQTLTKQALNMVTPGSVVPQIPMAPIIHPLSKDQILKLIAKIQK
jgi:hypothetical protein